MGAYDPQTQMFENPSRLEDLPVQSPVPLGKTFRYFVVTQQEVSATDGKGASVGLATYSVSRLNCFGSADERCLLAVETDTHVFADEGLLHLVREDEK